MSMQDRDYYADWLREKALAEDRKNQRQQSSAKPRFHWLQILGFWIIVFWALFKIFKHFGY